MHRLNQAEWKILNRTDARADRRQNETQEILFPDPCMTFSSEEAEQLTWFHFLKKM